MITSQYSQIVLEKIAYIEKICGHDVGRGIQPMVEVTQGGLLSASSSIAQHPVPHVAIITGFYLPHGIPPAAETDGPIGCVQLAAGLMRVGVMVRIVTDSLCFPAVKSAAIAAGIPSSVVFDIIPFDADASVVSSLVERWELLDVPVSHVISIERPAPSLDGVVRNMRGQDITFHTAPLHLLFDSPYITSIGIGDGGNELGMGNIPRDIIYQNIRYGQKIACVVGCDYLIVCGVSNWGGSGLLAALSLLKPEWKNAITQQLQPEIEFNILEAMVGNHLAIDGVTGQASLSVDSLPWEYHAEVLRKLNLAINLV